MKLHNSGLKQSKGEIPHWVNVYNIVNILFCYMCWPLLSPVLPTFGRWWIMSPSSHDGTALANIQGMSPKRPTYAAQITHLNGCCPDVCTTLENVHVCSSHNYCYTRHCCQCKPI